MTEQEGVFDFGSLDVPDSIQPYRGYKALSVNSEDGTLWSPQQTMMWPLKQRFEAHCTTGTSWWGWVPVEGKPRELDAVIRASQAIYGSTAATSSAHFRSPVVRPPKPSNPLPPGWNWSWEPFTHHSPDEGCHCGIYVVSEPRRCLSYVKADGIIAEVALWGKVIPAADGARGQYAYPTRLLVPQDIQDELRLTASLYGVPIEILEAQDLQAAPPDALGQLQKKIVTAPDVAKLQGSASFADVIEEILRETFSTGAES